MALAPEKNRVILIKVIEMERDDVSDITLKEALEEYKGDPRKDWLGYKGDVLLGAREENYLRLLLSDTAEAAHDAAFIAQDLSLFLSKIPINLEDLEKEGENLKTILESPFFDSSLLSLNQIDDFITRMAEYEIETKKLKRKISFILSQYNQEIFSISLNTLLTLLDDPSRKNLKAAKSFFEKAKRDKTKLDYSELIILAKRLLSIKNDSKEIKKREKEFSFASSLFKGIDTAWDEYARIIKAYRLAIREVGEFKTDDFSSLNGLIKRGVRRIEDLFRRYGDSLDKISNYFHPPFLSLQFTRLENKVSSSLSSFSKMPLYIKYRDLFTSHLDDLESFFSPNEKIEIATEEKKEEVINTEEERNEEIVFPQYPVYDIEKRAEELGVNSSSSPLFSKLLFDILDNLSPITERDALRYLNLFDGEKAKNKALELKGVEYEERGGFWYGKKREIKFRESSVRRDFSHIAPEELRDGMRSVLSHYKEMTREELYDFIGKKCGMKSVLSVRYRELDKVLFSLNGIEILGDNIRLVEDES